MKGQTQAVTAVMITGIVMGGIGTVYLWGIPMLEKRQVQQDITSTEDNVMEIRNKVISVSEKGSGASASVTLSADSITIAPGQDYIQITNQLDSAAGQGFTWSLLKGSSFQNLSIGAGAYGIQGQDLPGVVAFRSVVASSSSEITYRVEFRNLCSQRTGELTKIDLQTSGQERAAGQTTITLTNEGETTSNVVMEEGACEGRTTRTSNVVGVQLG